VSRGQISCHVVVEAEFRPAPRGRARACCLPLHLRGTAGRPGRAAVAQRDVACMINEITSSRCAQWVITTNLGHMPPSPDVCLPDITPTLTRLEILILTLNPKLCVFPVLPIRYIIIRLPVLLLRHVLIVVTLSRKTLQGHFTQSIAKVKPVRPEQKCLELSLESEKRRCSWDGRR